MWKFIKYLFLTVSLLVFLGIAGVAGGLYYLVVVEPGPEIEEEYIEAILGRESPVFYSDGETKLGVLFQGVHRQYLKYEQIPRHFVNAIVASEDDEFFTHFGVDIPGIVRAMIANVKAGRVVQGGSTITQQTAKNLYKRKSRSYEAKLKELLYALRLEYKYPKEKILEFYSNQFFVSGNGHGLGVAARYYFDKEPWELNLLECAFVAGSVKRPNYYNPFTKRNQADPVAARKKVDERVGYVLGKMLASGKISQQEYDQAVTSEVEFSRGKMSFRLNTAMDLVKDGLSHPVIEQALEEHGVSNVSTSGIRVITSIDYQVQKKSLYGLRHHLSLLDVQLRGYARQEVQQQYRELEYKGDAELRLGGFMFGTITKIQEDKKVGPSFIIDVLDGRQLVVLDQEGLMKIADALAKFRRDRWAEATSKDRVYLSKQLQVGDQVYISIREQKEGEPFWRCDLERFPEVEGAVLALQEGAIKAMVGGVTDRFFNRAVDAKRLMGSTLKPFLFAAAMQLGWSPVDLLDNRRDGFIFMNRPYFPRPDHKSPHDFVTMSWAGVKSENVAAVWLLYHLTDHLAPPQLREVAAKHDMAPREEDGQMESYQQFKRRIRDTYGIVVTRDIIRKAAFDKARNALKADFLFDERLDEYQQLQKLHYGLGFEQYRDQLKALLKDKKLSSGAKNDIRLRIELLKNNYLELGTVYSNFTSFRQYVDQEAKTGYFSFSRRPGVPRQRPIGYLVRDMEGGVHYTSGLLSSESYRIWPLEQVISFVDTLSESQKNTFWERVQLDGAISAYSYEQLRRQVEIENDKLLSLQPYSMDVLQHVRDYRVMVGLQYLVSLGKACGITSSLEPVLSFPLGSNVISLYEAVRMYETLVTGKRFEVPLGDDIEHSSDLSFDSSDQAGLAMIQRIEAPDGEVMYEREATSVQVFDGQVTASLNNILENTVTYGTGRYARNTVRLHSANEGRQAELMQYDLPVPLLGKTGTANNYRNASFLGYVPVLIGENETLLTVDRGYAVGVYAGYDTNKPMRKGTVRISGSQGALPVWSTVADALLEHEQSGEKLDLVDLVFDGLKLQYPDVGQVFLAVDPESGGKLKPGVAAKKQQLAPGYPTSLAFGKLSGNRHFEATRSFKPYWKNQGQ